MQAAYVDQFVAEFIEKNGFVLQTVIWGTKGIEDVCTVIYEDCGKELVFDNVYMRQRIDQYDRLKPNNYAKRASCAHTGEIGYQCDGEGYCWQVCLDCYGRPS